MKTAMQEFIINSLMRDLVYWKLELGEAKNTNDEDRLIVCENIIGTVQNLILEAKKSLEKERQQIIDAYNTGELLKFDDGEQYYNETYNQKQTL